MAMGSGKCGGGRIRLVEVMAVLLLSMTTLLFMSGSPFCAAVAAAAEKKEQTLPSSPAALEAMFTTMLTDSTYDYYFYKSADKRPWLVFLGSPWCPHCKTLKPQFINASVYLSTMFPQQPGSAENKPPYARLGQVDATQNNKLYNLFHVEGYPTIIYTVNPDPKNDSDLRWYNYEGSFSASGLTSFAILLHRSTQRPTGFMDHTPTPELLADFLKHNNNARVPFVVFIPKPAEGSAEADPRAIGWRDVMNGAVSFGNSRYIVMEEEKFPADWRATYAADDKKDEESVKLFTAIVDAAKEEMRARALRNAPATPDNAVLITLSDFHASPKAYSEGPWVDAVKYPDGYHMHAKMKQFITDNSFHAVEQIDPDTFSVLTSQPNYLQGIYVTPVEFDSRHDRKKVHATMRAIVQSGKTVAAPVEGSTEQPLRVAISLMDNRIFGQWRAFYTVPEADVPTFFIVDARLEKVFRMSPEDEAAFAKVKEQYPWDVNGPQRDFIERHIENVLTGRIKGRKIRVIGRVAELFFIIPGMQYLHSLLLESDTLFITMIFAFAFFGSVTAFSLWLDPIPYGDKKKKKAQGEEDGSQVSNAAEIAAIASNIAAASAKKKN